MNANELRIGNWVTPSEEEFKGQHFQVKSGDIQHIEEGMQKYKYEPIALTPEILQKMFVGRLTNVATDEYRVGKINIQFARYNNYNSANVFIGGELLGHYEHVHSFQNLIHALTGEELKIEL